MEMWIGIIMVSVVGIIMFLQYSNHYIMVSRYEYQNDKVPQAFHGFKILQISDLHGDLPKWKMKRLFRLLKSEKPDIVIFTGDAIDHVHRKQFDKAVWCTREISDRFPLYYVTGNHEYMHSECFEIIKKIEDMPLEVLHDREVSVMRDGSRITIYGVDDPYALYQGAVPEKYTTPGKEFKEHFHSLFPKKEGFGVLLSHRPEFFEEYVKAGYDLVFAGHAHGGQWRVPIAGGFIAPDQGLLPKYVRGKYEKANTTMFVSRGLGNSVVPFRLFNRPELVVVVLEGKK